MQGIILLLLITYWKQPEHQALAVGHVLDKLRDSQDANTIASPSSPAGPILSPAGIALPHERLPRSERTTSFDGSSTGP